MHAADVDANAASPLKRSTRFEGGACSASASPATHGGLGGGPLMFALVTEELTQACASTAMIYVMHTPAARAIAGGEHLTTLAFSEVGSRSHFWAPVSSLIPRDGCFETSARKAWVTSTNHADSYVASAQAHDASSIFETTLYIACRRGGIAVAGGFDGLGLRGSDSARVVFENARIPESDLLTPPGEGAHDMLRVVFPWFCVGTAAMANGLCQAAGAVTADHLQEAGYERTGQKLRDLPTLRARLAEMSVRTEQSRALLARTAA